MINIIATKLRKNPFICHSYIYIFTICRSRLIIVESPANTGNIPGNISQKYFLIKICIFKTFIIYLRNTLFYSHLKFNYYG